MQPIYFHFVIDIYKLTTLKIPPRPAPILRLLASLGQRISAGPICGPAARTRVHTTPVPTQLSPYARTLPDAVT
jgi:hypothetical protein